jgi:hypothetical protein
MIVMPPNVNYLPPVRMSYSAEAVVEWEELGAAGEVLRDLQFGKTIYRFLKQIALNNIRNSETGEWACWSSELNASIWGKGDNSQSAREDFKTQLHTVFQRLYHMRPFEMEELERDQWQRLVNVIDVHNYRTTTPVVVQEVGQVSFGKIARPYRVKWLTGHNYIIDPGKVAPELMSMKPGQYIEAVVKRDPVTHRELEIVSVRPISFHLPNETAAKRIWDDMSAADLPEGGWE